MMHIARRRSGEPFIFRLLSTLSENEPSDETDLAPVNHRTISLLMAIFAVVATLFRLASGVIQQ